MIRTVGDPIEWHKPKGNGKSPPAIIVTKKRGRPVTGKAMTNAQRQAKFKALKKAIT